MRFADLDQYIIPYLPSQVRALDIGVSTGVTSVELYKTLKENGLNFQLHVCDPYSKVSTSGNLIKSVWNENDRVICHFVGPICFSKNFRFRWLISKLGGYFLDSICRSDKPKFQRWILNENLKDLLRENKITWQNLDIVSDVATAPFDFVRIMNVLNCDLFSLHIMRLALQNIVLSVNEGGIVLIGRTMPSGINNAGIYRKVGDTLVIQRNINDGCEFHGIFPGIFAF